MAKFQNKALAGEKLTLPYGTGEVELDTEGFFEFDNPQLENELKAVRGFVLISEPVEVKASKAKAKKEVSVDAPSEDVKE